MGLAATQARLLSLTARQHAVEYDAQRIEAQKLQLANESDRVYSDYLAALDATKVQYKFVDDDGSYMFRDATFGNLQAAGFLFYVEGEICESFEDVKSILGTKTDENPRGKGIVDITAADSYTLLSTLVSEGLVVIMQQVSDPETGYTYRVADTTADPPEKNGWIVYNAGQGAANGEHSYRLNDTDAKTGEKYGFKVFQNTSVSSSTKLEEVSDETSLKKAEAQYESEMNRINSKDARYDNELSQLETERNAIKTEIETLEQVAKDNVDRTFKIFS